jgi:hypothetical protein
MSAAAETFTIPLQTPLPAASDTSFCVKSATAANIFCKPSLMLIADCRRPIMFHCIGVQEWE